MVRAVGSAGSEGEARGPAARIFTSRYRNRDLARRDDLVKVGITRGRPQFRTFYEYQWLKLLAPPGWLFSEDDQDIFRRKFRAAVLDPNREAILGKLGELSGGGDLVLLCFEDLRQPGAWCHRRIVAEWLEEQDLGPVDELGEEDR